MTEIKLPRLISKNMKPLTEGAEGESLVLEHLGHGRYRATLERYENHKAYSLSGLGRSLTQAVNDLEGRLIQSVPYRPVDFRLVKAKPLPDFAELHPKG